MEVHVWGFAQGFEEPRGKHLVEGSGLGRNYATNICSPLWRILNNLLFKLYSGRN